MEIELMDRLRKEREDAWLRASIFARHVDRLKRFLDSVACACNERFSVLPLPEKCWITRRSAFIKSGIHKGIPSEVHKMTMFIFSEQELRERDEDLRRQVRFDLATERALNMMSGRVQH